MENKKYFKIKCVIGKFETVLSQEISHILLSQGSQGYFGRAVVTSYMASDLENGVQKAWGI